VRDLHDIAGALAAEPGMKQQTYVLEGNGARPSHRGDGVGEDAMFTLNTIERHAVCYQDKVGSLCASDYKFPQQQQIEEGKAVVERCFSMSNYVVRRLTPTECALLQGFPQDWCAGLETPEPTEADIAFWSDVFEAHRLSIGGAKKPKTRNQIVKWLKAPHTDAAEYKLWGNGVALPCVVFVLSGIVCFAEKDV
jgi:DNA (cytosine-5)-methyltransferase 1